MTQPGAHSERLRRRVIVLFFSGLLLAAMVAIWIGRANAGWSGFQAGWLNQAVGAALSMGGLGLVVWSVRVQYVTGGGTPAPQVATWYSAGCWPLSTFMRRVNWPGGLAMNTWHTGNGRPFYCRAAGVHMDPHTFRGG